MTCLYWNVRGLANSPTKLALKRLIRVNKPDFVFIFEPWMEVKDALIRWLHRLGLKLFAINNKDGLDPNLWCCCRMELEPQVVAADSQQVFFLLKIHEKSFGISAVYASTNIVTHRVLWHNLSHLQTQFNLPWAFIGDFNCILGAHEHCGIRTPARPPIEDFNNWTNQNSLVHLLTAGALFTWKNGRKGNMHIKRRLDRTICNQGWLDLWFNNSCRTLPRNKYDHFPLLFEFFLSDDKSSSVFRFLRTWASHHSCEYLIADTWKTRVVGCPMFILQRKLKILKSRLKDWNKSTFGNVHDNVKTAEDNLKEIQDKIVKEGTLDALDVIERNAQDQLDLALQREEIFWKEKARVKWKAEGDRNTQFFHRIAKIKQVTKRISCLKVDGNLITDRGQIAKHVVSFYTNLFNKFFVLQDTSLIGEVIPHLMIEEYNSALTKLPVLEEVYEAVMSLDNESAPGPDGFSGFFYQKYWSIIKEDVFGAVLQFFKEGWIMPNYNTNTLVLIPKVPNADSIDQFRPIALANFKHKTITKILADKLSLLMPFLISTDWISAILHSAVMSVSVNGLQAGFFTCKSGVRQGDPLSPLLFCLGEDVLSRGLTKLVENKKVKLIKASRDSYVPSHVLYADDIMVFCECDKGSIEALTAIFLRWARNFIWSGEIESHKIVTVAWDDCCRPFEEGGLGLRSLVKLNEAANLKLCWDLSNSKEQWACLLKARVLRDGKEISYHIFPSLWSSMRASLKDVKGNSSWLIGNGNRIKFWSDNWNGSAVLESLNATGGSHPFLKDKAAAYIQNCKWNLPTDITVRFPNLANLLSNVHLSVVQKEDLFVWNSATDDILTLKTTYDFKSCINNIVDWGKLIWNAQIPASSSLLFWRLLHNKVPTDDNMAIWGFHLPSVCNLCGAKGENVEHLFFSCSFAAKLWNFLSTSLAHNFSAVPDIWSAYNKLHSAQSKVVLQAAVVSVISMIWIARNVSQFEDKSTTWSFFFKEVKRDAEYAGNTTPKVGSNSVLDFQFLKSFNVKVNPPKAFIVKEFSWHPPVLNWLKCNTDGAATGAELSGAILAIEIARQNNWTNLWLESGSKLVVLAFSKPEIVPWTIWNRWENVLHHTRSINFLTTHKYREGNHCADRLANIGLHIQDFVWWDVVHREILMQFAKNYIGLPNYRISH
ncbi:uncharacterized protein LOC131635226 [Vicia villosa]|uniref:uncharacterized protein LOC131635226 n=1 Tax=Vicia villosa TaxID=3911 RepID=UPI00273B9453|nr:uncharacterized protein LOC131635226 [Vicia villosa]